MNGHSFLNASDNRLLWIATHFFTKSDSCRSAKFTTGDFECIVRLKKFTLNKTWVPSNQSLVLTRDKVGEHGFLLDSCLFYPSFVLLTFVGNLSKHSVLCSNVVVICYLTTTMYYSHGQRPSPSKDGWDMVWMIYGGHMITGANVAQIFWHLSYSWGKTPEKTSNRKLTQQGMEPGPAAWEATILTLDQSCGHERKLLYKCTSSSSSLSSSECSAQGQVFHC